MQRPPVPGAPVWLRQQRWRVDRAVRERRIVRLDVSNPSARLTVLEPYDRVHALAPRVRPVCVTVPQAIARLAHLVGTRPAAGLLAVVVGSPIDLWPHQVEPALAARDGHRRLLVADDVGLGKTIQAGIIVADVVRERPSARVLVVAPASLCRQWAEELQRCFGLRTWRPGQRDDFAALDDRGSHSWRQPGVCVASIDYLKQPHVFSALPADAWDVVVIDEVHIAAGQSDRHEACDELARRARQLVMLSATPHDGDPVRFARLTRLGRLPDVDDPLLVFRRTRHEVTVGAGRAVRWHTVRPSSAMRALMTVVLQFERAVLARASSSGRDDALLFLSVLRKRALSSALALRRTLDRRLAHLATAPGAARPDWTQPRLSFDDDVYDTGDDEVWCTGMSLARERTWVRRLQKLAVRAERDDPKLRRLRALVCRTNEPVVIFTEYRDTLDALLPAVQACRTTAVIHGGQDAETQHAEIDRFLSGTASALVATDVASQGLNLQGRARWVVAMDLPWNPIRLEQRIGRLDRLGQRRRVHTTILVGAGGADRVVLLPLVKRLVMARQQLEDSALDSLVPPSRLVAAAAVIDGREQVALSLPSTRVSPAAPTRAFARRARAHTRVAQARRQLRRLWRSHAHVGERPVLARWPASRRPGTTRAVAVVAVPLIDGAGAVVDQRFIIAAVSAAPDSGAAQSGAVVTGVDVRTVALAAARLATTALLRQVARRARQMRTVVGRRLSTEQAIAAHLHTLRRPRAAQLGLFSQRGSREFDDRRLQAAREARLEQGRMQVEATRAQIVVGDPTVVWIAVRR